MARVAVQRAAFADPGAWGPAFTEILDGYENTAGLWIIGEDMPQSTNRVTLNADVKDQHGLPVPNVHFDDHPNDVALRTYAWEHAAELYRAVGAVGITETPPYRPSTSPSSSRPACCRRECAGQGASTCISPSSDHSSPGTSTFTTCGVETR